MENKEIIEFIETNRWIFARTYAAFCPHEYVVKERLSEKSQKSFVDFLNFIEKHGFVAYYGKTPRKYYIVGDYYYFGTDTPIPQANILNRAKLSDFEFVELLDGTIKIRRRKKS